MRISVIGTGYLGATHAACLAVAGHTVVGVDLDAAKIDCLRDGRAPFREDGLDELLQRGLASGRLSFTTDLTDAADAEVHFLCVGTPESTDPPGRLDLTALWSALEALAPLLRRRVLVVGRSTVPAGTAAAVRDFLRATAPAGDEVALAWNPEFLREGHAVSDSLEPHRIVVGLDRARGGDDSDDSAVVREVYADWLDRGVPLIETDLATAELAKLSANAMLAVRVSMTNVLAEMCEAVGADVDGLLDVVGGDPRIGRSYLQPGLGYGGSCLPKDIRGLAASAGDVGLMTAAQFLQQADRVNLWQRERTTALAADLLGGAVDGRRIGVLGLAFKGGSDDVRESPAMDVVRRLVDRGALVTAYDPGAADVTADGWTVADSAEAACAGAELVLVLTDWPQFRDLDPGGLADVVLETRVVDARHALDRSRWQDSGWECWTLGLDPVAGAARDGQAAMSA